jgi:D-tyrosyl-tRNA(Tyr) deacylase
MWHLREPCVIGLLQRVTQARVEVDRIPVGAIGRGLLVFIAVEPDDSKAEARRLIDRLAAYRVFGDADDRMNLSVADVGGELLLVSQFTLAADTRKGLRPSFTTAAPPELGQMLFDYAADYARTVLPGRVATGRFGACMQVSLTNDGPVTFWIRIARGTATE